MKIAAFSFIIITSSLILFSCKKEGNPAASVQAQPEINLYQDDVSCTEVWIKLKTENIYLPAEIDLYRDSSHYEKINLTTPDTVLYVDSLLPDHSYSFHSIIQSSNQSITSNFLRVITMDTTSHNFTWQMWTFGGQAGSCGLYDVAIINENNIWAVGEIYLLDSTGGYDPNAYNAVQWDGNQWELKRIKTNGCGGVDYVPIKTIFAFSSNDVLFAHKDGSISHFNGIEFKNDCSLIRRLNGSANKMWGRTSNDFYVVSSNGFIAHYQNKQWSRIESGTNLRLKDIYGTYNSKTNDWEILATGSDYPDGLNNIILSIRDNAVSRISTDPIIWPVFSTWFVANKKYYTAGSGIYSKHKLQDSLWQNKVLDITTYTTTSIRGNEINDVMAVGAFGDLVHFNGVNWKNDYEEPLLSNGSYTKVAVNGDILVAVGSNHMSINSEAVIIIGRR